VAGWGDREVLTRIESSLRWLDAGPTDKFFGWGGQARGAYSVTRIESSRRWFEAGPLDHYCRPAWARFESSLQWLEAGPTDKSLAGLGTQKVMTRFESATLVCRSQQNNLSDRPAQSQRSDDSIRVSTSCWPKPAGKLASRTDAKPSSHHRLDTSQHLSRAHAGQMPAKHLPVGPASSQRSDDSIQVSTSRWPARFESVPLACPACKTISLPDRNQTDEVMTRFESEPFACPSRQKNVCPTRIRPTK
jgi:hypothetical protein